MAIKNFTIFLIFVMLFSAVAVMAQKEPVDKTKAVKKAKQVSMKMIEGGRYLVKVTGCNDCHTSGYDMADGNIPEKQWLTGDSLGWRGPWGTTYGTNLRIYMQNLTEDQWVSIARSQRSRPPMPWFSLRDMTENDLRAIYQFIRHLGPGGEPAPAYLPPGKEPKQPYVQFPQPPKQ